MDNQTFNPAGKIIIDQDDANAVASVLAPYYNKTEEEIKRNFHEVISSSKPSVSVECCGFIAVFNGLTDKGDNYFRVFIGNHIIKSGKVTIQERG